MEDNSGNCDIFLSYVREDVERIDRLRKEFDARGANTWLDRDSIKPGARWEESIRNAISGSTYFVVCISNAANERPDNFMLRETIWAMQRFEETGRPKIIPVLLDDCAIPELPVFHSGFLRDLQAVDMFSSWDGGVWTLVTELLRESTGAEFQPVTLRSKFRSDVPRDEVVATILKHNIFERNINHLGVGLPRMCEVISHERARIIHDRATSLYWLDTPEFPWIVTAKHVSESIQMINKEFGIGHIGYWDPPTIDEALTLLRPSKNQSGLHLDGLFHNSLPTVLSWDDCKLPNDEEQVLEYGHWTVNLAKGEVFLETQWDRMYAIRPVCRRLRV